MLLSVQLLIDPRRRALTTPLGAHAGYYLPCSELKDKEHKLHSTAVICWRLPTTVVLLLSLAISPVGEYSYIASCKSAGFVTVFDIHMEHDANKAWRIDWTCFCRGYADTDNTHTCTPSGPRNNYSSMSYKSYNRYICVRGTKKS